MRRRRSFSRRGRRADVAFYSPWAGPSLSDAQRPTGGAETQVIYLARGLAASGAAVRLLTRDVPGLPTTTGGVDIVAERRPAWSFALARYAAVAFSSVVALLRLRSKALVQRSAGAETGLVGIAARLTRSSFVFSSANTIDFAFEELGHGRVVNALYALGVRLADTIVVQTDEQADLCRARFGREPVVIRSVAEPADPPRPGAASAGFLWIGRLVDYKRPLAFADLAASVPEAPFVMVGVPSDAFGGPDLAAELARRAAALPNFTILPPQARPDMMERIARATAIVSTSDFEGMPNTLIEGWSRGIPALTLSHDPDGLIEREGIGACAGGEPDALVKAAQQLWNGRSNDAALRERCRRYARREHHPDAVIARWRGVLGLA